MSEQYEDRPLTDDDIATMDQAARRLIAERDALQAIAFDEAAPTDEDE